MPRKMFSLTAETVLAYLQGASVSQVKNHCPRVSSISAISSCITLAVNIVSEYLVVCHLGPVQELCCKLESIGSDREG
jgi:hypothetical protein